MTSDDLLWDAIKKSLNTESWTPLFRLDEAIEALLPLDEDDLRPRAVGAAAPRWKENARNVLQAHKQRGEVLWDRRGNYKLP